MDLGVSEADEEEDLRRLEEELLEGEEAPAEDSKEEQPQEPPAV